MGDNWSPFALKIIRISGYKHAIKTIKALNVFMCPFVLSGGRTLQILKAKVSDGGKYSCVAMNAAGEAYKHIYLTVFSESTSTVCVHWAPDFGLTVNVFPSPRPFSSSKYPGQQWGLSRGGECARREIINSGVWVQRCTSSHHHLVQERQGGDRISQPAHPGRGADAWDQRLRGERWMDAVWSVLLSFFIFFSNIFQQWHVKSNSVAIAVMLFFFFLPSINFLQHIHGQGFVVLMNVWVFVGVTLSSAIVASTSQVKWVTVFCLPARIS